MHKYIYIYTNIYIQTRRSKSGRNSDDATMMGRYLKWRGVIWRGYWGKIIGACRSTLPYAVRIWLSLTPRKHYCASSLPKRLHSFPFPLFRTLNCHYKEGSISWAWIYIYGRDLNSRGYDESITKVASRKLLILSKVRWG